MDFKMNGKKVPKIDKICKNGNKTDYNKKLKLSKK